MASAMTSFFRFLSFLYFSSTVEMTLAFLVLLHCTFVKLGEQETDLKVELSKTKP